MNKAARDDKDEPVNEYARNAQHGANAPASMSSRTGPTTIWSGDADRSFSSRRRICDEGDEIRERARERGTTPRDGSETVQNVMPSLLV